MKELQHLEAESTKINVQYSKTCLKRSLKIDKTQVFTEDGS